MLKLVTNPSSSIQPHTTQEEKGKVEVFCQPEGVSTAQLAAQSLELSEQLADQSLELTEDLNQTGQSLLAENLLKIFKAYKSSSRSLFLSRY